MMWSEKIFTANDTDRTSELRKKGFEGRRLGPKQMTTDTAVRVTRIVVQDKGKHRTLPRHGHTGRPL